MSRYEVTSFDFCTPGFERLRSQSEFIPVAYPGRGAGWRVLRDAWLQDLQCCDRGECFDFGAARAAIRSYCLELRARMRGRNMRAVFGDFDAGPDGCAALLYIRDTQADE